MNQPVFITRFKTYILLSILITFHYKGIGQMKLPSIDYRPQSPAAAAFSRYGEIPVDHSTGVPSVEIPIWSLKVGSVNVPINITYHSSGNKVRDVASEVGLGFLLQTGGAVTTTIIGLPDVDNVTIGSYKNAYDIDTSIVNAHASYDSSRIANLAFFYWNRLTQQSPRDHFSDRFYYSLTNGESGVFRRNFNNDSLKFMPFRPITVSITYPYITITGSNGYIHYFESLSTDKDYYVLKKVLNDQKTDSILYYYRTDSYGSLNVEYHTTWKYEDVYLSSLPGDCGFYTPCLQTQPVSSSDPGANGGFSYSTRALVDSIVSKDAIVHFSYIKDRYDDVFGTLSYPSFYRLTDITIKDPSSRDAIKSFGFKHSYFGNQTNQNRRLRLDTISVYGNQGFVGEKYSFNYDTSQVLPSYPHLDGPYIDDIWHEDYWGYYNGSSENNLLPSFCSTFGIANNTITFADLEPVASTARACILTEIKYPTGGKTVFEYEPNEAQGVYYTGGGVRIKKIISYTNDSTKSFTKSYTYSGALSKAVTPAYYKWDSPEEHYVYYRRPGSLIFDEAYYSVYKAFSNSLRPILIAGGAPVIYTNVTEYFGDTANNTGKITYIYSYPEDADTRYPLPGSIDMRYISYFHSDCGNYVPQLLSKSVYKRTGGTYELVNKEENVYSKYRQHEFNTGVSFSSTWILENFGSGAAEELYHFDDPFTSTHEYLQTLVYNDTKGFEEVSLLATTTQTDYGLGGTFVATTTAFQYDSTYTLLKRQTSVTSDSSILEKVYKRSFDYPSQAPYTTMLSRNILSPVIEESIFRNSSFLESQKTNYDFWNGTSWTGSLTNLIVPRTIQTKRLSTDAEIRIRFLKYDNVGNPMMTIGADGLTRSYIRDYNNSLVIADCVSPDSAAVAYTSFEADGKGNWSFSGTASVHPSALTGSKVYSLSGNSISVSGLSTSTTYTVTYWTRDSAGSATVNGNAAILLMTRNGWKLYSIQVSGNSSVTISGNAVIDALRLYPTGALMTTYTYDPLIGMTSQCDATNRITYYEYDAFRRLRRIRDQDKNVIKVVDYQYQQTQNQ